MSSHENAPIGLDDLARMLEAHEGPLAPRRRPSRPPSNRRRTLAVAAGALAVGTGAGFALASTVAPAADAEAGTEGFGFLPAQGWNVMQSGSLDADGVARAIAANVPLDPRDGLGGEPRNTLRSLPARGVVLSVTFSTRGDPAEDVLFPVREEPLALEHADPIAGLRGALGYRLRSGIGGYNVDVRVYVGSAGQDRLAVAKPQLERLVVAADQVTIFAQPTVVDREPVRVFGSVDARKPGETVEIQAKDCGNSFFRAHTGAETREGGGYSTVVYPRVNTTLRAVWNGTASNQVTVGKRVSVNLFRQRRGGGFLVAAGGIRSFWRKHVLIQARRAGTWSTVKRVVLTDSVGTIVGAGSYTEGRFRLSVPKGTLIRAVLPLSQAKPCYLPGVSRTLRT